MNINKITKEDFEAYEEVRVGGLLNMMSSQVQEFAGISEEIHLGIIEHYTELMKKYPEVRE